MKGGCGWVWTVEGTRQTDERVECGDGSWVLGAGCWAEWALSIGASQVRVRLARVWDLALAWCCADRLPAFQWSNSRSEVITQQD